MKSVEKSWLYFKTIFFSLLVPQNVCLMSSYKLEFFKRDFLDVKSKMFGKGKKIFYRIGEESICPISCKIKFFQVLEEIKLREFVTHIRKKLVEELLFLL